MALLTPGELGDFMQRNLKVPSAELAIRVADGWLRDAARIDPWPGTGDPPAAVPADLYAWAIELAAIAYDNPTSASGDAIDDASRTWSAQQGKRRVEILDAARAAYPKDAVTAPTGPIGCFPAAPYQPDLPAVYRPPAWPWGCGS